MYRQLVFVMSFADAKMRVAAIPFKNAESYGKIRRARARTFSTGIYTGGVIYLYRTVNLVTESFVSIDTNINNTSP